MLKSKKGYLLELK